MTNSLDEVSRLPLFLEEIAEETAWDMAEMMSLNVALEEALVNVIHYAYPQMEEGKIVLTSATNKAGHHLLPEGLGRGFRPPHRAGGGCDPLIGREADWRIGYFLIRNLMDEVAYRREGDCNVLIMRKNSKTKRE